MGPEDSISSEKTIEKVFFPVRYVRYTGKQQLLHKVENSTSGRSMKQTKPGLMSLFMLWHLRVGDWIRHRLLDLVFEGQALRLCLGRCVFVIYSHSNMQLSCPLLCWDVSGDFHQAPSWTHISTSFMVYLCDIILLFFHS